MSNLIIVRGLPGSGKDTFADTLTGHVKYSADMFFMKDGVYQWDWKKLKEAHAWCLDKCKEALINGEDVVVANIFDSIKDIRPYLFLGYSTTVYKMVGDFGSKHGVPESTFNKIMVRWEDYSGEIEIKY